MKRKELVSKLIKEGFSVKTLATMSDKELKLMADRVLNEQSPVQPVTNVSRTDITTQNVLKQQKKPFATYEGEMKEEDNDSENSKAHFIKKIKFKMEHETDKTKIENLKELLRRMGEKAPKSKMGEFSTVGLNEWVNHLVGKNVHPFTTKTEILSLINKKLNEQETDVAEPKAKTKASLPKFLTYDAIHSAGAPAPAEPTIKPTTRPGNPDREKKRNPLHPGPGINPAPKAEKK